MRRSIAVSLTALALLGGCGSRSGEDPDPGKGVDVGAAVLRSELTALLVDRAQLTGFASLVVARSGAGTENAERAEEALGRTSEALGDALATARDESAGAAVARALRAHDDVLLARAAIASEVAPVVPSEPPSEEALAAAREQVAAALRAAAPGLPVRSARSALGVLDGPLDALLEDRSELPDATEDGAERALPLAESLASAVVAADPSRFEGDPGAGAAELRSQLSAALQTHVHHITLAAALQAAGGTGVKDAREALDRTAIALGDVVTSVYGQDAGSRVRALWRAGQSAFAAYTSAKLAKDDARAELALVRLDETMREVADAVAGTVPTIRQADLLAQLRDHVAQTTAALRAVTTGSPKQSARVQAASGQVLTVARTLAGAIQRDAPAAFPPD